MRVILLFLFSLSVNAATLINQYDSVTVGNIIINNNIWNSPSGTQKVLTYADASWEVDMVSFNKPTNGAPGNYPFSQTGCHHGVCTPNNPLPKQVRHICQATTSWLTYPTAGIAGSWNKSLDIWFNTTPTTSVAANAQELMIWADYAGPIQPIGTMVGTFNIDLANYEVWHGGIVTTYRKLPGGVSPTTYNVKMFMHDAMIDRNNEWLEGIIKLCHTGK